MTSPLAALDERFLARIDSVMQAHTDWTGRILRCAVFKEPPGDDVLAPDAHSRCRLGIWLAESRAELEQLDVAALARLQTLHKRMHDAVRTICLGLLDGSVIEEGELEAFLRCQSDSLSHLARLKAGLLAHSARIDALTKLPLRHNLEHEYYQHVARAHRHALTPYLALLDVDHFKQINDTYGHIVGDCALKHVASVLRNECRKDEPLFRFGGEEFLLLLEAPADDAAAKGVDRLLRALKEQPLTVSPHTILRIRASCGIVRVAREEPLADALARVDVALYAAKAAGRDRYAWGISNCAA